MAFFTFWATCCPVCVGIVIQARGYSRPLALATSVGGPFLSSFVTGSQSFSSSTDAIAIGPKRPTYQGLISYYAYHLHGVSTMYL